MKKLLCLLSAFMLLLSTFSITAFSEYENTHINTSAHNEDIAGVALTQIGAEGDNIKKYGNNNNESLGFLLWCAQQAAVSKKVIPNDMSLINLYNHFSDSLLINANPEYVPAVGDIMFLGKDDSPNECAIVISSDSEYVTAVLLSGGKVSKMMYNIGIEKIIAYARPDYSASNGYETGKYMTTASFLNLRSEASTSDSILAKIPIGTIVNISEFKGDWGKIEYDGKTGWISMDYAVLYDDSHSADSPYAVKWNVIDVSKWQGNIDWTRAAAGGANAVILRIGFRGTESKEIFTDDNFLKYYNGAKEAGLHVGCYFYSAAASKNEASEEARFIINLINEHSLEFDMPVYIDMEDPVIERCGKSVIYDVTKTFLDTMAEANIYSGVYASTSWALDYYNPAMFANHALWIAEWKESCSYPFNYGMWQYTSKGSINGVESKYTDLNICYIDYPSYIADKGFNKPVDIPVEEPSEKPTEIPTEKPTEIPAEESTEPSTEAPEIILGDVDFDGRISAADARLALRISAFLHSPTNEEAIAADINSDNSVTASDARQILRISAGLE